MFKPIFGCIVLLGLLMACKNDEKTKEKKENEVSTTAGFGSLFNEAKSLYKLSDTGLAKNTDTTSLPSATIGPLIPDSIKKVYFGKNASIKYTPLVKLVQKGKGIYYIVKASSANKKAALLLVFDNENKFGAAYPFLLPDEDPTTSQVSLIDKNLTISKNITQRTGPDITGEGKEVVAYDTATKTFVLIMTDVLNDNPSETINPIDTFPKTNKLAGDYFLNKKNIVSVRDGRHQNQLLVYIHTENEDGNCSGELKGEFLITSATSAAYRLGGDPCILGLSFSGNAVSIKEESGCGNHRGLDCPLSGTFTRKKQQTIKQTPKKLKGK
ncbi:MAG: hypothetical protein M3Y85_13115 [Bacteroidota bacterium]|nr:hypothetical protein [Bacteroidota bacterium]